MTPGAALCLLELSPDLTAAEWGQRLDVPAAEVRAWCDARGVPLRGDRHAPAREVARRVDVERRRLGWSLRQVARDAGVDHQTVTRLPEMQYLHDATAGALWAWVRRVEER
jgi:hypothetical protein